MRFEFVENITRADIAFRAYGDTIEDLFLSSASAVITSMIDDIKGISRVITKEIIIENTQIDLLLFDFLEEFIFFKDSEAIILLPEKIDINKTGETYRLNALLSGEEINRGKHVFNTDVKSITMHEFNVVKKQEKWEATVVLDV